MLYSVNYNQTDGAAHRKFVIGAKVLAAVPSILQPGGFISNFLY